MSLNSRSFLSCRTAASRRVPMAARVQPHACRRDVAVVLLLVPALLSAGPSLARDPEAARAAAEERKRRLREVAEADRASGKDQQVFKDSEYMMGEDARTPNVHSRQDEGARTQVNS